MSDAITVRFDSAPVLARLQEIARRVDDLSPAMRGIGELIAESTKDRFTSSIGPDGQRWKANAPTTVLAMLNKVRGAYSKRDGKLTKKGAAAVAGKRPLVETGILQDTIRYQLIPDGNGVEIGTNRFAGEWEGGASVHQFGSRDGNIPARPFLGLSASDEREILAVLDRFMRQAIGR